MKEYHKIQTVYKRDPETKYKTLLQGDYSLPEFSYLADNQWTFTEKVDGTNIRILCEDNEVLFRGKTDRAQLPADLVNTLSERFSIGSNRTALSEIASNGVCLYGEGYGPKIQKGDKYRSDQDFVLFDVFINGVWLAREVVEDIAARLCVDVVPIIGVGTLADMVSMAKEGFTSQWGDFTAEGIVARPTTELATRRGGRIITKVKHRDFR